MWETVPRLLDGNRYLVLGTADAHGRPWATPVFFAPDGVDRVLWVSSPDSRHSRNIAARPEVAITVFDSHAPIGGAEAVYLEATAKPIDDGEAALSILNGRLPAGHHLDRDDLATLRAYEAVIGRYFVLIRGGDQRFENVTDARLEVHKP